MYSNAPINLKPTGGGGGRAWGGDLTFFKKLLSNSLPRGKPFQPKLCIKISPPQAAYFCQSFPGWMQERRKENMKTV